VGKIPEHARVNVRALKITAVINSMEEDTS
jgi:hypothetical protein